MEVVIQAGAAFQSCSKQVAHSPQSQAHPMPGLVQIIIGKVTH